VKAYLYTQGERFMMGHSVAELIEKCNVHDKTFKTFIPIGAFLDRFYIPTRYPNGLPGGVPAKAFNRKDSAEAIKTASMILDFISKRLGFTF
jgi:HEPN domain-containing protein